MAIQARSEQGKASPKDVNNDRCGTQVYNSQCEDSNRVETIDLLKKQLMSTKRIIRINERSRVLNSESAFQAIHEAYQELSKELEDAYSISQ